MQRQLALNPVALGLHESTLYEPQRTNHFEVYIYLPSGIKLENGASISENQKYITMATTDFSLPNITVNPISIPYGNTKINLAGSVEFGGADSLTCTDFIGADVEGILYAWQNLIYSPETGQMGWAVNYKTNAQVLEYSADGACLASWVLRGVWPTGIQYGQFNKSSSDIKSVSVSLSYDLGYRKFGQSTRNLKNTEVQAAEAMDNMRWKPQNEYKESNDGGPINSVSDQFN